MESTLALTEALIRCPSITPKDLGCQDIIIQRLTQMGFRIERFEIEGVSNLWARIGDKAPLLVLAGHTDVVPVGNEAQWHYPPFAAMQADGLLYGRGAADMKGGLAAMITACERFLAKNTLKESSLAFLITSDEEGPSIHGTRAVLEILKKRNEIPTWCLVGEPSSETILGDVIKVGRRGSLTGFLTIRGKQGHVAYPHLARNPVHFAVQALNELLNIQWQKADPLFPETNLQIVNIQAGTGATNVIPSHLDVNFNIRFSPPLNSKIIQSQIEALLHQQAFEFDLRWHCVGNTFYTEIDSPLIKALLNAVESEQKLKPRCCTKGGTSDGRFFAEYGCHVAELGLINATIHQVNEHVQISDLLTLSRIYESVLEQLLT
ncbi:succinyl-diaminopimelate desuccinylase [Candidatus Berkiella cookevillensis]|uniref:Succinyl-diaminopimelate desuccinylase n=1 Tax=Candidatus Berkiella cookevillensis TaxID=437022 RepID=A0A0Q9YU30_9GAMM|nr:succinyl-diaminopimelate desuccinylase [Candidatus Berkiella cookevillensis]MCS5708309.1 succinyl-diaminopimelate desuccinylase [Candidatus Berkiella cookevillensis]